MSPFRPSFFPSPVCFRAPRSYSLLTHYSLPTTHYPLSPALCFHILTNPFSRNSFTFTSIQTPGGVGGFSVLYLATRLPRSSRGHSPLAISPLLSSTCRLLRSLCPLFRTPVLCFQSLAASFCKTPGVGVSRMLLRDTRGGVLRSGISATSGRRAQGFPPLCLSGKSRPCFAEGALKLSTDNCRLLTAPPCQPGGPVRGAGPRRSAGRRSGQARRCLPSSSMDALHPPMPVLLLSSDAHRATRRGFGWPPGSSHAYSELLPRQRLSLSGVTPTARSGRASPQRTGGKPR